MFLNVTTMDDLRQGITIDDSGEKSQFKFIILLE